MPRGKQEAKFKRHAKVVAAVDLPGVPAGTRGKVQLVNGLRWIRYWVVFKNGVELGQLGNDQLMDPAEWDARDRARRQRERAAEAERRRQQYLESQGAAAS
jgi:hypothetical protein